MSRKELIRLQGAALRARDLEDQIRTAEAATRTTEATTRARVLLAATSRVSTPAVEQGAAADALDNLPLTGDGRLHEAAFDALHQRRLWAGHEELMLGPGAGA